MHRGRGTRLYAINREQILLTYVNGKCDNRHKSYMGRIREVKGLKFKV